VIGPLIVDLTLVTRSIKHLFLKWAASEITSKEAAHYL